MMKRIVGLLTLVLLITALGACNNKTADKAPEATLLHNVALRTSVSFEFTIDHPDDLVENSLEATIYRKTTNARVNSISIINQDGVFVGQVANLLVNETYRIEVTATHNKKPVVLLDFEISTSPEGSVEQPKEIRTVNELLEVRFDTAGHFKLMQDIDLAGQNWTPLFNSVSPFTGVFDGNGFTISNYKQESSTQYVGFFGYSRGTIKNFHVSDVTITITRASDLYIGAVVAYTTGVVENVSTSNVVITGTSTGISRLFLGGLVGYMTNTATLKDSRVEDLNITASGATLVRIGGLIGYNATGNVSNVHASGNINGALNVTNINRTDDSVLDIGGIVADNRGTILDAFSNVAITATTTNAASAIKNDFARIGLIAGHNVLDIQRSVATGSVTLSSADVKYVYVGGLVGLHTNGRVLNSVYVTTDDLTVSVDNAEVKWVNAGLGLNLSARINDYVVQSSASLTLNDETITVSEPTISDADVAIETTYTSRNITDSIKDALRALGILS